MKRAFVLLGLLLAPLSAAAFSDVPAGHESRRTIEYLQREGVLQGYADGLFRPAFPINRAELLKVLVAATGAVPPSEYGYCYPDVLEQWFAPYVCYATAMGWVQGYPDGTFGPERPVTFAETLKMLGNVRGHPKAPAEESERRGIDPSSWFAPHLTTALLLDVVSYGQVWGDASLPLQAPLNRGVVAQLLYRALLAEGAVTTPLATANCRVVPAYLEIRTYVDVVQPSRVNVYRQDLYAADAAGATCLLATDANPFGRVTPAFDPYFLQPYPAGQPKGSWTARVPLTNGKAVLRAGTLDGVFRQEVFVADVFGGTLTQLPSIFAAGAGSVQSPDGRYAVYVGAAGRTVEAIDLVGGAHAVLDAVDVPLTFLPAEQGAPAVSFPSDTSNVVAYTLYDSSVSRNGGHLVLELRTADLDAAFLAQPYPFPPASSSSSSAAPAASSASSFYDPLQP